VPELVWNGSGKVHIETARGGRRHGVRDTREGAAVKMKTSEREECKQLRDSLTPVLLRILFSFLHLHLHSQLISQSEEKIKHTIKSFLQQQLDSARKKVCAGCSRHLPLRREVRFVASKSDDNVGIPLSTVSVRINDYN
jgi:hypothetical protein